MAVTYKDIDLLSQKASVAGTEKLPVSDTEYITPAQIIQPVKDVTDYLLVNESLDGLTTYKRQINSSGSWVSYTSSDSDSCVLLPITPGEKYQITGSGSATGYFAILAESSPKSSGSASFATGYSSRLSMTENNNFYEFVAPSNAASIYLLLVNHSGATYDFVVYHLKALAKYITTETDPTVPSWAKEATKPTYTASEVGALPDSTTIPSDLDDLSDVNTGTPSDGDVLTYDSTTQKWVADAPSGGELSTDVVADKASNTKASTPKSVYDFVKPATQSSQPAGGMVPGIMYNLGTLSGAVTFSFASPSDSSVENEYKFTFDSGSTAAVPTWPVSITSWVGNCVTSNQPVISASKHYEVSVEGGYGVISEF